MTELGDLAGEALAFRFGRPAVEAIDAKVLVVGSVLQHVMDGGQDRRRRGADRLLRAASGLQAGELAPVGLRPLGRPRPGRLHRRQAASLGVQPLQQGPGDPRSSSHMFDIPASPYSRTPPACTRGEHRTLPLIDALQEERNDDMFDIIAVEIARNRASESGERREDVVRRPVACGICIRGRRRRRPTATGPALAPIVVFQRVRRHFLSIFHLLLTPPASSCFFVNLVPPRTQRAAEAGRRRLERRRDRRRGCHPDRESGLFKGFRCHFDPTRCPLVARSRSRIFRPSRNHST